MSSAAPSPHLLSAGEIMARTIAVDRAMGEDVVRVAGNTTDQPAGIQVLAAQTIADVQRITGAAAFRYFNPSYLTFITAR